MKKSLRIVTLDEILTEFTRKNKNNDSITVYSVTNEGGFVISTEYFSKEVYSKDLKTYKIVEEGDFAYNPSRINVGSIDYFRYSGKGLISPLYVTFKAKDCIDNSYLKYYLKSPYGNAQIRNNTSGSVRDTLSFKQLSRIQIPILPLEDQKRIIKILDKANTLRQKRRQAIELLDDYLKSVFLYMFGDLVKNPKEWKMRRLSDIADIASGVTKGRKIDKRKTVLVPYMRVANVQDEHIDLTDVKEIEALPSEVEKYRLLNGDLLLTEGGDPDKLGRGGIWRGQLENCIHQNHIFRVRLDDAVAIPEYISAEIGSAYGKMYFLKSAKQTTGIASINMTQLKNFPVLLPDLRLQIAYSKYTVRIELLKQQMLAQSKELENQFQALMQKAFKGEL